MQGNLKRALPILIAVPITTSACTTAAAAPTIGGFGPDFWQKVTIALIAAVFGFIANYALAQLRRRAEPRKQLSYDIEVDRGLVAVQQKIKEKIKVFYEGHEIGDLYHVTCNVQNSGNTVVRNQYLRFSFSPQTQIVDEYFDPEPQPEIDVRSSPTPTLKPSERRYSVAHLEKGQGVAFRFITTGSMPPTLEVHPSNEAGDVGFVPRSVTFTVGDLHHIQAFVTLFVLFWIIPPIIDSVLPFFGPIAAALIRLAILAIMAPHIRPFARVASDIIVRLSLRRSIESRMSLVNVKEADMIDVRTESKE